MANTASEDKTVERIGSALADGGTTLAIAESCTGGLVAKRITDRPGASAFFEGGVVTYSNAAKQSLLNVRRDTLIRGGAVSEEVVREMLHGVRRLLETDAGIAVTGIAGPAGGSPEKPVGTVWYGASVRKTVAVRHQCIEGSRPEIRERAATAVLRLLDEILNRGEGA